MLWSRSPLAVSATTLLLSCAVGMLGARLDAQTGPEFDYGFVAPSIVRGEPGEVVEFSVDGTLGTRGLEPGAPGAQGWTVSLSAQGCFLVDITTDGTVAASVDADPPGLFSGGFNKTELSSGGHGDCTLLDGAVSAIVLSFTMPITLDPGDSPHTIYRLRAQAITPVDARRRCRFFYVDGCQGSGMGVENFVTYDGTVVRPTLSGVVTELVSFDPFPEPVALVISDEPIGIVDDTTAYEEPLAFDLIDRGEGAPAATLHVGIVSRLEGLDTGVQGWSLSVAVQGDLVPVEATVSGTAAAPISADPPGLRDNGFEITRIVDPTRPVPGGSTPQGEGVVTAVVLSFSSRVWLPKVGTAEVLRITVESRAEPGDAVTGGLVWRDDLVGDGSPVDNVATVEGTTVRFRPQQGAVVRGVVGPDGGFRRCDANGDGRHDLADAVWIVNALFRAGPAIECADAGDCDDDGRLALSDAVYAAAHQFLRGPEPPAPFADCGADPTDDELGCERAGECP